MRTVNVFGVEFKYTPLGSEFSPLCKELLAQHTFTSPNNVIYSGLIELGRDSQKPTTAAEAIVAADRKASIASAFQSLVSSIKSLLASQSIPTYTDASGTEYEVGYSAAQKNASIINITFSALPQERSQADVDADLADNVEVTF